MYITKITLEKVRCFDRIEVNLATDEGVRKWLLLLGDNGTGKSTILRSVAMGLVDATSASALLRELYGEWVRQQVGDTGIATIFIEFDVRSPEGRAYSTATHVERTKTGDSKITQETYPEDFPWDDIFVCGYGAARRGYGSKDYAEYSPIDAVYTLFNYDAQLQNPELILRRLTDEKIGRDEILKWIDHVLMLPEGSTKLTTGGIVVTGPWGRFMPLGALGDGHQATLAWVVDMLGWVLFYDKTVLRTPRQELTGILLLDEIEQHLHPIWGKSITALLRKQFPGLQFIVTTHSPLCAIGTSYLTDQECALFLLEREEKEAVTLSGPLSPPRGQRADQVLTSYLFGLTTSSDNMVKTLVERYADLASKSVRSQKESAELNEISDKLDRTLGAEETELGRVVSGAVMKILAEQQESKKFSQKALEYETKRRLKDLLSTL